MFLTHKREHFSILETAEFIQFVTALCNIRDQRKFPRVLNGIFFALYISNWFSRGKCPP